MPRILNMPAFWLYQGCEYAKVVNMLLVLNISRLWIYHGSKYARVTQGSEYAWTCPNNSRIIPVWMDFVLHLPIVIPYLRERWTVFLKSENLIFSVRFCFLFYTEYFCNLLNFKSAVTFGGRACRGS